MIRRLFGSKSAEPAQSHQVQTLFNEATRAYESVDHARAVVLYERAIALCPDHAEAHYKRGNALKAIGHLAAALASYDEAIRCKPGFAHAWCNRGVVQQGLGLSEAAFASYDRAIALDPDDAVAHSNRGSLLQATSRWNEALASYNRALELNGRLFEIWFHRGNVLKELQQFEAALISYAQAVKLKPDYAEAHYNRGVLQERTEQPRAALLSYEQAIAIYPRFYQAHYNRAGVLKALKDWDAALAAYERAIAEKSDYAEAYVNRGAVLQELARFEAAVASYDRAITIRPNYPEAYFNRGTALKMRNKWEEALASYDASIALRPSYAASHCQRAVTLMELNRPDAAVSSFDQAIAIQPDFAEAQYNRALALLLGGDYENGWLGYEWRWKNTERLSLVDRAFSEPIWLGGERIAGRTLLIYAEQGFGDTLQFCRFAKAAADLGATVILEVRAPLVSLLASLEGVSRIIAQGQPLPEFDYRCPLMSLPLALKTTIDTIPSSAGYLRADSTKVAAWRSRLGNRTGPRIGLTWSGNPQQGNDRNRSMRLSDLVELLPREFEYCRLQKEVRPSDQETLAANPWISDWDRELHDFSDTAALCECLDLVISVDTSVAHLCGALGRPTWVLLSSNADWRWLLDRDDSPWYRSVKLYRQQTIGDWRGVVARVAADLRKTFDAVEHS
jgi:tetratricopeptide (TPR) repeat protein